ncbi:MAG: alpha/beta fold hydrolase [Pseudomonadota bacterium]
MMDHLYLTSPQGRRLAYRDTAPNTGLTFVWLSGFKSDMSGSKVTVLEAWAKARGHGFLAFDYSGHGLSGGAFEDGTISAWREDALAAIEGLTSGRLVLVGSSMGGWMALLAALALKPRVAAMVLIAPAPDFTQKLMWPEFSGKQQSEIKEQGRTLRPTDYGDPYPITRDLIEDGKNWTLLDASIDLDMPIRILQGQQDPDVPWQHAFKLVETLRSEDLVFHLIKDGDHRLSREQDIARLVATCGELVGLVG